MAVEQRSLYQFQVLLSSMRILTALLLTLTLSGCAQLHMEAAKEEPVDIKPRVSLIEKIPPLDGPVVTVAV